MNRTTALTAAGLLLVALPLAACTSSKPAEPAQQGQPAGGATAAPTRRCIVDGSASKGE